MIKTFEKTLSVRIDNTILRCVMERLLDEVVFDSDLIYCINDALEDESREAFELIVDHNDFVKDEIVSYVKNAILEKFEIEKE